MCVTVSIHDEMLRDRGAVDNKGPHPPLEGPCNLSEIYV